MFCNECGAEIPEGANFCVKCGKKVDLAEKTEKSDVVISNIGRTGSVEDSAKDNIPLRTKEIFTYEKIFIPIVVVIFVGIVLRVLGNFYDCFAGIWNEHVMVSLCLASCILITNKKKKIILFSLCLISNILLSFFSISRLLRGVVIFAFIRELRFSLSIILTFIFCYFTSNYVNNKKWYFKEIIFISSFFLYKLLSCLIFSINIVVGSELLNYLHERILFSKLAFVYGWLECLITAIILVILLNIQNKKNQ